jgi:hypothetical protein
VSDSDVVIASAGCTSITRNLAECEVTGDSVSITAGDLDDVVTAPVALRGGGDDTLLDVADGGPQIDTATQCEQMFDIP